jgi:DNA-binding CsgD family transcriptional regulator
MQSVLDTPSPTRESSEAGAFTGSADDSALLPAVGVVGRAVELETIERFLTSRDARTLVMEGEPGIGKSTLWRAGIEMAEQRRFLVLQARPAALEGSLSFVVLRDLVAVVPPEVRGRLPEAQRRALSVALAEGGEPADPIDRGVVAVAVMGLLRELSARRPLLVAIDDLHWLDEPTGAVIASAIRRTRDADVRLLATLRGANGTLPLLGLEHDDSSSIRLRLGPLSEGAIRRIVRLRLCRTLSRQELHALYGASEGNPFHAIELARSSFDREGLFSLHVSHPIHELVRASLESLPKETDHVLPFVAPFAGATVTMLVRAGVWEDLEPALAAGILELDNDRVRFAHPLVAAAVWEFVGPGRRRDVHRALAAVADDPERGARHLAAATSAPDGEVAELLERSAAVVHFRGAPTAAADLLDEALRLTPARATHQWARIARQAASAHAEAGHWDSVGGLVRRAQERLGASTDRAAILTAAAEMGPGNEGLMRQAVLEAAEPSVRVRALLGLSEQMAMSGRFGEAVRTAQEAEIAARHSGDVGLLGVALTRLGALACIDSRPGAIADLRKAGEIEKKLGGLPTSVFHAPRTYEAFVLAFGSDPGRARELLRERLDAAMERGDDLSTFQASIFLFLAEFLAGEWDAARTTSRAGLDLAEIMEYEYGRPILLGALARLEACEGRLESARALATGALSKLTALGERFWSTIALGSLTFTELCSGDSRSALTHAQVINERFPERECSWSYHQGDEIEALVLAGQHEGALSRAAALRRAGIELELPRFLAWADRGEGLVLAAAGDLPAAQVAFESALSHHDHFTQPFERARTVLALGVTLRRSRRRRDARETLGEALDEFVRLGAAQFVRIVRDEQKHVGGRPPVGVHELTAAEDRVARLVASGRSNREVAEELFITVSTVEATLTRVYRKLQIKSRSQLSKVLTARGDGSQGLQ